MKYTRGSAFNEVMMVIGFFIILIFFVWPKSGVNGPSQGFFSFVHDAGQVRLGPEPSGPAPDSSYASSISLGQGNASYSTDPSEEYVTIENDGTRPINITGWKLVNGKNNRVYEVSGNQARYPADSAVIPKGVNYVSPSGANVWRNIVLNPGDTAIVTTGSQGATTPYPIVSFRENECSSYLGNSYSYDFVPSLNTACVLPPNEPSYDGLDRACKNLVSSLPACRVPTIGQVDHYTGQTCDNCVNGTPAPSDACLAYIKAHFSYTSCLDTHKGDTNFYGNTWRVFLGQKWEMWAAQDETIYLYDESGKLAASRSY